MRKVFFMFIFIRLMEKRYDIFRFIDDLLYGYVFSVRKSFFFDVFVEVVVL